MTLHTPIVAAAIELIQSNRVLACPRSGCGRRLAIVRLPISTGDGVGFDCGIGHTSSWVEVAAQNGLSVTSPIQVPDAGLSSRASTAT